MQRYFAINNKLELSNKDLFHISNVMRMKEGQIIEIVYDKKIYTCKINDIKNAEFEILSTEIKESKYINIKLAIPLLKEAKMDYIFQKATEIGVSEFIPIYTERSIIKKESQNKFNRWKLICKEASEQSKRVDIPIIREAIRIKELVNIDADLKLLCTLSTTAKKIKKVLQKKQTYDTIIIVSGPEGGFTTLEEEQLLSNGYIPVTFGDMVLRAETAPIYMMSIIKYEFMG